MPGTASTSASPAPSATRAGLAEVDAVPGTARAAILVGALVLVAALATRPWARSSYHLGVAGLASINWLLDCLALYVSLRAVDADVPLRALIATYAIAQIVAVIPLLPGGGGTVEASLVLGFAAFGHTSGSVVAGVVLYRLISNWGLVGRSDGRGDAPCRTRRERARLTWSPSDQLTCWIRLAMRQPSAVRTMWFV